ncbi:hypothetical protein ACIOUG_24840 [Pseudomonas sp. NPDC087803]|uniref:hypothetical protein n=1 Tax=Pseudomonas sp. NPDC087803 TaxID=3364448 RepID=UPI003828642B
MKGKFISYDESTGEVKIEADTQVESSINEAIRSQARKEIIFGVKNPQRVDLSTRSKTISEKKFYYLIVPEGHRSRFKITPNAEVEFELVEKGSTDVKSISF